MTGHNQSPSEAFPRNTVLPGLFLAFATIIGVHSLAAASDGHRALRIVTIKSALTEDNSIYGTSGIVAVAGASVLLLAWLHRQASRTVTTIEPPATGRTHGIVDRRAVQPRKASISHHFGGLYGP